MDEQHIENIVEILDSLLEDLPFKVKEELSLVIKVLKNNSLDNEKLMKIQDDLEMISNMGSIDSFSRNEIINIVTEIESIYNS